MESKSGGSLLWGESSTSDHERDTGHVPPPAVVLQLAGYGAHQFSHPGNVFRASRVTQLPQQLSSLTQQPPWAWTVDDNEASSGVPQPAGFQYDDVPMMDAQPQHGMEPFLAPSPSPCTVFAPGFGLHNPEPQHNFAAQSTLSLRQPGLHPSRPNTLGDFNAHYTASNVSANLGGLVIATPWQNVVNSDPAFGSGSDSNTPSHHSIEWGQQNCMGPTYGVFRGEHSRFTLPSVQNQQPSIEETWAWQPEGRRDFGSDNTLGPVATHCSGVPFHNPNFADIGSGTRGVQSRFGGTTQDRPDFQHGISSDKPGDVAGQESKASQITPAGRVITRHSTWAEAPSKPVKRLEQSSKSMYSLEQAPISRSLRDELGELQGVMAVYGARQNSRATLKPRARVRTARAKGIGVCLRCKKLKRNCNWPDSVYLPCDRCRSSNPLVHKMPCLRIFVSEIALFRLGPPTDNPDHPLNFNHRKDILLIAGEPYLKGREIELTQDMGQTLKVTVSPFIAQHGDKTAYEWISADRTRYLNMPHYHISNNKEAKQRILEYISQSWMSYLKNLLRNSNPILRSTFKIALRSRTPMINKALRLWSTTRLIERTWKICGAETLGMQPVSEMDNPWNGIIPVTPIMDQQLDQIVIWNVLTPLRELTLKGLKTKLEDLEKARQNWFEIYLTIFVLLNNAEYQLAAERRFAQRYGMSGRFGPKNKYKDAEDQFHAAKTLLAHFHHVCRGSRPLLGTQLELLDGSLKPEQKEYVTYLRQQVEAQKDKLVRLYEEHQYEKNLYWCHQLFSEDWQPGSGIEEVPEDSSD